jgi:hypothetical protein
LPLVLPQPALRRENNMLKGNKLEIEQIKEEAQKYESFVSAPNIKFEHSNEKLV